jgi:streptomycin 6-kinase
VIDINPPTLTGDRAFDLATMLFYLYDRHDIRERLRRQALELTSSRALSAYLAHMLLRQVDWSLRHHPGTSATTHHLSLARLVAADLPGTGASWPISPSRTGTRAFPTRLPALARR